jgi:hypothetical protein
MSQIGAVNRNRQRLIGTIVQESADQTQYVWVLRCQLCGYEYGSKSSGFEERKCPNVSCQKGPVGLPITSYRTARA